MSLDMETWELMPVR